MSAREAEREAIQFNRRSEDVNYKSVSERLAALEDLVNDHILPQLETTKSNIAEIHAKNDEMYASFILAKNAVKVFTKIGDGVMRLADVCGKLAKPLFWLTMLLGALWGYLSTGHWVWPK